MLTFRGLVRWLPFAAMLALNDLPTQAQTTLPNGITKVTSVEGITEYQLKNGLRVLLFPDPSKPTVTVNITYLVGSRHEGLGETGMAHLLEHMLFKGSPKHTNVNLETAQHGALNNATTWYDRTNYYETVAATDENLQWALDFEADRMINANVAKKDLESEFSVVRNEFEIGENYPQSVLMERVLSSAYLWHNYGKSTIGSREDIERVPVENLQAFYKRYYQPDNAVLLIAGKIDEAKTLALVDRYFSPIPKPTRVLPQTYTVEPVQDGERSVTLRRTGDTQGVAVAYHTPSGSHADYATIDVLTDVMTNEPSGRLYKALIESKKAALLWGWSPALHDPGFALFYTELRKDQSLDSARRILLGTLDAIAHTTISADEVERAKSKLLKDIELLFQKTDRLGLEMSGYIATGDWRLLFLYRDNLRKVSPADVQRVASAYLKPSNRTVGVFLPDATPDRSDIPSSPDVAALVNNYKGEKAISIGEAFDPSPTNIENRTHRTQEGKGVQFALLPKSTRGNSVAMRLTLRYGDATSLQDKAKVADFTAAMLERGTKTHSYQQIKDELDKLKARVSVYGGGQTTNVAIEATKESLPAVLKVVMDYLRNPTFPENEFNNLKQERLALIEMNKQEPQAVAFNASRRLMNPYPKGHPLYVMTFDEEIKAINALKPADVTRFYKDFYGADKTTVAVVGDFDEAATRTLVKNELSFWKAAKPYIRVPRTYASVAPTKQLVQTNDKTNAMLAGGLNLAMRDDDPDFAALYVGNQVLGGSLLSRLWTRVREKEGISYGVGTWLNADEIDKSGNMGIYAMYNPENGEKLTKAIREEFDKVLKEGITAEECKAIQREILQNNSLQRSRDAYLAGELSNYLAWNRTFAYDTALEKKIESLTPDQINTALRKYIDPDKLVLIQAGDFAKAAKKLADKTPDTQAPAAAGSGKKN